MEPKFSVDTTIDADIQYEASKSLMPRYVQLLTWVCFGLSVVLLGIMVWQYVMTKNTMHLVLALLLVLVVGFFAIAGIIVLSFIAYPLGSLVM